MPAVEAIQQEQVRDPALTHTAHNCPERGRATLSNSCSVVTKARSAMTIRVNDEGADSTDGTEKAAVAELRSAVQHELEASPGLATPI